MYCKIVLLAIMCSSVLATGPNILLVPSKDPNILFIGIKLLGKCSACDLSHPDLVWGILREGGIVTLEEADIPAVFRDIRQNIQPEPLCEESTNRTFLHNTLIMELTITEQLDGAVFACLSREDLNRSCAAEGVFCTSSKPFRVIKLPTAAVTSEPANNNRKVLFFAGILVSLGMLCLLIMLSYKNACDFRPSSNSDTKLYDELWDILPEVTKPTSSPTVWWHGVVTTPSTFGKTHTNIPSITHSSNSHAV